MFSRVSQAARQWRMDFIVGSHSVCTSIRQAARCASAKHWGETGGTPADKDGEIRVRMGKSRFGGLLGRGAATGVFCRGCGETKGIKELAPHTGHVSNFCGPKRGPLEPPELAFAAVGYDQSRLAHPVWAPSLGVSRTAGSKTLPLAANSTTRGGRPTVWTLSTGGVRPPLEQSSDSADRQVCSIRSSKRCCFLARLRRGALQRALGDESH
jgi:hypothetical protein